MYEHVLSQLFWMLLNKIIGIEIFEKHWMFHKLDYFLMKTGIVIYNFSSKGFMGGYSGTSQQAMKRNLNEVVLRYLLDYSVYIELVLHNDLSWTNIFLHEGYTEYRFSEL